VAADDRAAVGPAGAADVPVAIDLAAVAADVPAAAVADEVRLHRIRKITVRSKNRALRFRESFLKTCPMRCSG
jgi:hypothetical protein